VLDTRVRRALAPPLDRVGAALADAGLPPLALTAAGFVAGLAACGTVVAHAWVLALVLWLTNRLLDGLDGPVARRRGATDLGGFLDIVADFTVYAGFVVAVAVALPAARVAALALLMAYYVSGTAFLALSSLLERRGLPAGESIDGAVDRRSLRFVGGLAEGTETVLVYVLFCLFPQHAAVIAWLFTAAVAVTAVQRVALGVHLLRGPTAVAAPTPSRWATVPGGPTVVARSPEETS
jgi:phosphatidylglycerophosphate synthase